MSSASMFNVEKTFKLYSKIVKSFTKQQLTDALSVLIADPDYLLRNNLGRQFSDETLNQYRKSWQKLSMFETERYQKICDLIKEFDVFEVSETDSGFVEFIGEDAEFFSSYPKLAILIDVIQRKLRKIETGDELPPEMKIKTIEIFYDSGNDYLFSINQRYEKILEVSIIKRVWEQFYNLCSDGYLSNPSEGQYIYDYFNYRFDCKLYTQSEYPPQQLINKKNNGKLFEPNFEPSTHSLKTLARRKAVT